MVLSLSRSQAASISRLADLLQERVIVPGDAEYDAVRAVAVSGFDRRPAAIARPASTEEVRQVIVFARESGLDLAVRGGGHSIAGHAVADDAVVLDLASLRDLEIDAERRTAWAGAGLKTGEYTKAAGAYGLNTGFGDTGSVGIGGITLGGGIGYLTRRDGLTIDNLVAAEVVTADGQVRLADAEREPDLFWALRGGGGNFGVVTRFQFRLVQVDTVVGGMLMLPATAGVLAAFLAEAEAASDELSAIVTVLPAPPLPFVPAEMRGQFVILAQMVYAGETEAGARALAPFSALATPVADLLRPMRYPDMFQPMPPDSRLVAGRSGFLDRLDRSTAELLLDRLRSSDALMAAAQFRVMGGATARVPADATAFAHRRQRQMFNVAVLHQRPEETASYRAWIEELIDALPDVSPGVYVNFLGNEGEARVRDAYPGPTWDRLRAIKSRFDPENFFCHNQNIPPADR